MRPEEIISSFENKGFCIFNLGKSEVDAIPRLANELGSLTDGFYQNDSRQISFFNASETINTIEEIINSKAVAENITPNKTYIIRVVESGSTEMYRTHFDSHLYTLVIPLILPKSESPLRGQFYFLNRFRKKPKSEIENLLGKSLAFIKYRGKRGMVKLERKESFREVDLKIGQAMLFEGSVSLHGNYENKSGVKRITLILHFNDPFPFGAGYILRQFRSRFTRK